MYENHPHPLQNDASLAPYAEIFRERIAATAARERSLRGRHSLAEGCNWHLRYGMHRQDNGGWLFREWLPNAVEAFLIGEFSDWSPLPQYRLRKNGEDWEIILPPGALHPGQQYRLLVRWDGGEGQRIPSAATQIARSTPELWRPDVSFNAVIPGNAPFTWRHPIPPPVRNPLIYEAHVGMAQDQLGIGTFDQFRLNILPRVKKAGYNVLQLMGVQHHPYYASFGYHVTSFFAPFDQLGSPEDFKRLVDEAHGMGLRVIIDLVHSHAANNEVEGLSRMDGTEYQFFHGGPRGWHCAWGSRVFDYAKPQVLNFLLSNCRFWLEEYHIDGFRFDGITSMLYLDHGLGCGFWDYKTYFDNTRVDNDAILYLTLANRMIHAIRRDAITIAEDVSGYPGLGARTSEGGIGFDYRLAMGVTDYWFKLTDMKDEDWDLGHLWYELNSRRGDERTISYVECHDQALVGGKTFLFTLIGADMYYHMATDSPSLACDRGIALHKMARLLTFATAGFGYLNFMGNEFGHPEWIDFPTERNGWSFQYARRQWHLADDPKLNFHFLNAFDQRITAIYHQDAPDLFHHYTDLLVLHEDDKVLAFSRGPLLFLFNFHPWKSYSDYGIPVPPGTWKWLLDSDQLAFGGYHRIAPEQRFFSQPRQDMPNRQQLMVYLPARTALVLRKENKKEKANLKKNKRAVV